MNKQGLALFDGARELGMIRDRDWLVVEMGLKEQINNIRYKYKV